jgi:hypothetical protein
MPHAVYDCKRSLFLYRQDRDTTLPEYHKQFKSLVDVIEYNGGSLGADEGLIVAKLKADGVDPARANDSEREVAVVKARDTTIACAFILGVDKSRFGKLKEDLENAYTQGDDKYPKDLTDAYKLLTNWKQDPRSHIQMVRRNEGTSDVTFTNIEGGHDVAEQLSFTNLGRNNPDISSIRCYNCQQMGHYAGDCTNERVERAQRNRTDGDNGSEVQMLMSAVVEDDGNSDFSFHTDGHTRGSLPSSWILLDNQSTVHIFSNSELLKNIRTVDRRVSVQCNAGTTTTNMVGDLKGFGEVWYHPHGIANILSMSLVENLYPVTYSREHGFMVHKADGTVRKFVKSERGLFYMDVKTNRKAEQYTSGTTLFHTVADKKTHYTNREYRAADLARKIQRMIGRPSLKDFLRIVDKNQLVN